jgi:hypothetical protein
MPDIPPFHRPDPSHRPRSVWAPSADRALIDPDSDQPDLPAREAAEHPAAPRPRGVWGPLPFGSSPLVDRDHA